MRLGKVKIIITGSSKAPITTASFGGLSALKAMSTCNDDPATASRSFDIHRDGFVMGEGAGALEVIICLLSMRDNVIPPTINTTELDPAIPENLPIVIRRSLT